MEPTYNKRQKEMKLIIDSGSTKSDLKWVKNANVIYETSTVGINPFYQDEKCIYQTLHQVTPTEFEDSTESVFFYGAGCSFKEKCDMVHRPLSQIFSKAKIEIHNDLLGAARALFQHEKGIACILGTGANSCIYNGEAIVQNVPPLGFILGDEGSGAVLGKLLVSDILKGIAPQHIQKQFYEETDTNAASIMENIYKKPFPNRYLAQFSRHIYLHKDDPFFRNLILTAFDRFFERNIQQYETTLPIGFIGSIAHYFQDELHIVASSYHKEIIKIEQSPISGLIQYHA